METFIQNRDPSEFLQITFDPNGTDEYSSLFRALNFLKTFGFRAGSTVNKHKFGIHKGQFDVPDWDSMNEATKSKLDGAGIWSSNRETILYVKKEMLPNFFQ